MLFEYLYSIYDELSHEKERKEKNLISINNGLEIKK